MTGGIDNELVSWAGKLGSGLASSDDRLTDCILNGLASVAGTLVCASITKYWTE